MLISTNPEEAAFGVFQIPQAAFGVFQAAFGYFKQLLGYLGYSSCFDGVWRVWIVLISTNPRKQLLGYCS